MKIKHLIAGLVILGSCPTPALAWPLENIKNINWDKVFEDSASKLTTQLTMALLAGLVVATYKAGVYYLTKDAADEAKRKADEEQHEYSRYRHSILIQNNDNSIDAYEKNLEKLRKMAVVYKDSELQFQCEQMDKQRANMIIANAMLKDEFARRLQVEAIEKAKAEAQQQQAAQPAPSAPAAA